MYIYVLAIAGQTAGPNWLIFFFRGNPWVKFDLTLFQKYFSRNFIFFWNSKFYFSKFEFILSDTPGT